MPWTTDENGERVYKLSIYAKEELPTWSEVYDDFYQKRLFEYNPELPDHQELDLYWKIPRRKYLLATVCNQFNKMLFEENMRQPLMEFVNKRDSINCTDVRFSCIIEFESILKQREYVEMMLPGSDNPPPIFTFPMPSEKKNPFALSKHPRIDVSEVKSRMCLYLIYNVQLDNDDMDFMSFPYNGLCTKFYEEVIEYMMKPFKEYFEGPGVGWKDKNGNLIETDPLKRSCNGAGYDPAL